MNHFDDILDDKGQILPDKVEDLLIEIASGKCVFIQSRPPYEMYAARMPTPEEQSKARIVYARALHSATLQGVASREELAKAAVENKFFDPNEQIDKRNQEIMIGKWMKARSITTDPGQKLQLDADLMKAHRKIAEIEAHETEIFRHSRESHADDARTMFYVSCCTLGGEMLDEPVWSGWEEFQHCTDTNLIRDARRACVRVSEGLPIKIIRALARTRSWRDRWKASKEGNSQPFEGSAGGWDKNKLSLIYWSDFYDSIYAHPECPPEEIVNHDDFLQDWLNQQMAKRKQQQNSRPTGNPVPTRGGKPMVKVGESHRKINAPVKVRTRL